MQISYQPLPPPRPSRSYERVIYDSYHETWYDPLVQKALETLYDRRLAGYGGTRDAAMRKRTVLKVPRTLEGCWANIVESLIYRDARKEGIRAFAPCRLLHTKGIPLLLMDRLVIDPFSDDMGMWLREHWGGRHDWDNLTDAGQVGAGQDDRLYFYDYAHLASLDTGHLNPVYTSALLDFDAQNDAHQDLQLAVSPQTP